MESSDPVWGFFPRRSDLVIMLEGEWFEAEALVVFFFFPQKSKHHLKLMISGHLSFS